MSDGNGNGKTTTATAPAGAPAATGPSRGPGPGFGPGRGGPGGHRGGPMGGMGRPVEKAKNFGVSMRRLVGFLKPHMVKLIVVLVLAIGSTMIAIFAPKIMGHFFLFIGKEIK